MAKKDSPSPIYTTGPACQAELERRGWCIKTTGTSTSVVRRWRVVASWGSFQGALKITANGPDRATALRRLLELADEAAAGGFQK